MKRFFLLLGRLLRETFWIAVAVALVVGGVMGFRYLGDNREVVEAEPVPRPVALVETMELAQAPGALPIRGEGFVNPLRELSLSSQVGGRVTFVHPAISERGRFEAGEVLIRLDDRAAAAALEEAEANIAATEARIDQNTQDLDRVRQLVERGVATRTQLDDLISAQDELNANMSGFLAARLSAEIAQQDRTVVAPFSGAVLSEEVEVGDVVSAGQALAEVFTEGELEIDMAVRQADAALIPGLFEGQAATATVDVPFADYVFRWTGHVARVSPQVDPATRTLTVTVRLNELADVTGRSVSGQRIASGAPPALINAYATVVIDGARADGAYRIPSTALRGGQEVWIYEGGALEILEAMSIHVDGEETFIESAALRPGMRLITSALSAPVAGMALRDASTPRQATLSE